MPHKRFSLTVFVLAAPLLASAVQGIVSEPLTQDQLKALDMLLSINTYLLAIVGATLAFILPNGKHFFSCFKRHPLTLSVSLVGYLFFTGVTFLLLLANQYTLFNQIKNSFIRYADLIGEEWVYFTLTLSVLTFFHLSFLIFRDQNEESKNN